MDVFNGYSLVKLKIYIIVNKLISKGMSNIYLEVTIEKKSLTQDIEFLSLNVRLQFTF